MTIPTKINSHDGTNRLNQIDCNDTFINCTSMYGEGSQRRTSRLKGFPKKKLAI